MKNIPTLVQTIAAILAILGTISAAHLYISGIEKDLYAKISKLEQELGETRRDVIEQERSVCDAISRTGQIAITQLYDTLKNVRRSIKSISAVGGEPKMSSQLEDLEEDLNDLKAWVQITEQQDRGVTSCGDS